MQKTMNCASRTKKEVDKPTPSIIEAGYIENEKCFNIMFVRYDDERSMEVVESSVIDFNKVVEHLEQGNSVFIAPKRNISKPSSKKRSTKSKANFYTHI